MASAAFRLRSIPRNAASAHGCVKVAPRNRSPLFHQIESLHRDLHTCGADILTLNAEARAEEAARAVTRLHSLRDNLLAELKLFLKHE